MREKESNADWSLCSLRLRNSCSLGTRILSGVIVCYQWTLSPLLGPTCRFYPSCSSYTLAAIEKYGVCKGVGLALLRLLKCHPWHPGGFDPLR